MIIDDGVIRRKIDRWLASLPPEFSDIKDDIVVAGGCIVSMLLEESINDFDIFLTERSSRDRLLEYYLKLCNREGVDLNKVPYIRVVVLEDKLFYPAIFTRNAITLTERIQIVIKPMDTYMSPSQIVEKFDFLHTQNYWTYASGIVTKKEALECILTKKLIYTGSDYPVSSLIRVAKYLKKGWRISPSQMFKIAFQVSELDLSDSEVFADQIIGWDLVIIDHIISELQTCEKIDYSHLCKTIDKAIELSQEER